ncbi:Hypothetical protein CINCED_3A008581 [Cinara cedri]|nr:Hypothetical protein CINCED_3A008581 [Cinara cedri]
MIDEHYRSLITNVIKLADVDGHARWRQQEHNYLSALIEKRLKYVQNPPDCSNAQKVVCQFDTNDWYAFGCRLHHLLNCMVTAYGSGRTMVMYNHDAWEFTSGGWNTLFLPLSDTCESVEGKTVAPWPRNSTHEPNTQVLTLVLPLITVNDSNRARPPFIPLILPEDLATRINVLHGDPGVWWIGQFLKYMLRPQKSISDKITAYAERIKFRTPCVGVHVRRTDKIKSEAALHNLDEYMYHVGEYYKIKELYDGRPCEKRIYLATDEPQVFDEAKLKYPDYEIIGDPEISKTGIPKARKSDNSLVNVFIDIHFLASCEYLVCTFSSNVCRIAYEIMNSVKPDASAMFTSLDDTYYFNDQIHRLNVAILPHKAEGPEEMDLQVGDQIEVAGNHWNGYSKGMNLRTKQFLLYPTFKVIPKIETIPFATYPNITINIDEFNEEINE